MAPLITWLLPVKNGMPFLTETLASIESQTYRDWQVLAWDNGSTDGTVEELHRWIPARLPGKVITGRPLGLGASLAEMTILADTPLCARIDADDVNLPTRLEEQVDFLKRRPDVAVVGTQVIKMDESGKEYGKYLQLPLHHDDIVHRMLYSCLMAHPSVVFRRQAVIEIGNYRDCMPVEDYDLWMRLTVKYKLANLEECLLKYRVRESSVTQQALKQNLSMNAMLNCFTRNAPALYGCSAEQAQTLRKGNLRFAFPVLLQIVRHLCRTQGGTVAGRLRSESFHRAVAESVPSRDVVTHLLVACYNPTPLAALRDMGHASKRFVSRVAGRLGRALKREPSVSYGRNP
jgi:glycosyltransferase involved in cell wall biosynthesis